MRVSCRLGCGTSMWLKMRTEHESVLCSERLVECKWRCGGDIKVRYWRQNRRGTCGDQIPSEYSIHATFFQPAMVSPPPPAPPSPAVKYLRYYFVLIFH